MIIIIANTISRLLGHLTRPTAECTVRNNKYTTPNTEYTPHNTIIIRLAILIILFILLIIIREFIWLMTAEWPDVKERERMANYRTPSQVSS